MMKGFSSYMFLWGRLQVIELTIGRLNFDEESLKNVRTCWQFVDVFSLVVFRWVEDLAKPKTKAMMVEERKQQLRLGIK